MLIGWLWFVLFLVLPRIHTCISYHLWRFYYIHSYVARVKHGYSPMRVFLNIHSWHIDWGDFGKPMESGSPSSGYHCLLQVSACFPHPPLFFWCRISSIYISFQTNWRKRLQRKGPHDTGHVGWSPQRCPADGLGSAEEEGDGMALKSVVVAFGSAEDMRR